MSASGDWTRVQHPSGDSSSEGSEVEPPSGDSSSEDPSRSKDNHLSDSGKGGIFDKLYAVTPKSSIAVSHVGSE